MAQATAVGEAQITAYIRVDRVDGEPSYYKVIDEHNIEISEQEYKENS